ncbi:hypothetical protein OSTOST_18617 [Ostertagia ostertagi]
MKFDSPKPEDLEFEYIGEKPECLITVRRLKDFNDDIARKLFPISSAQYFPSTTYTVPGRYFSEPFWAEEKRRLQRIYKVWEVNKRKLETDVPSHYADCMAGVIIVIEMCKWMLGACWDGDRSKPPIPLHLYRTRMRELKEKNHSVAQGLQELSSDMELYTKAKEDIEIMEVASGAPKKRRVTEGEDAQGLKAPPEWRTMFLEQMADIVGRLSKVADDVCRKRVSKALAAVADLRQCMKDGSNYDQAATKLKKLVEMVKTLERKASEPAMEMEAEGERHTPSPTVQSATCNTPTSAQPKSSSASGSVSKKTRKSGRKSDDSEEKRADVGSIADDPNDDLISRVKRGQRNRRPTRSFTPGWTPPGSPIPSKPTFTTRATSPAARDTPPINKPTPLHTKPQTTAPTSPDSGRPSSNESSDNTSMLLKEQQSQATVPPAPQLRESGSAFEKPSPTFNTKRTAENKGSPGVPSPPMNLLPSTPNLLPHPANFNHVRSPQLPPLNLNEQGLMAIWKEKIQLGDVRITLLNMFRTDGAPQYHFIPLMIETIDKAIAALDKKDMISFAMHKGISTTFSARSSLLEVCRSLVDNFPLAAIEVGCNQLGSIMRSCNPVDPTSQLASLAAAMGINPAPFTSMLQPSPSNSGLNPNMLADLHGAAAVVAAREQMNGGGYSFPPQPMDQVPGFVERDISKLLL